MADSRALLEGLVEYHASIQRHVHELRDEFADLQFRWEAFRSVYEGDAAEEFKRGWDRSTRNFQEYLERTEEIAKVLNERIGSLTELNRPTDLP